MLFFISFGEKQIWKNKNILSRVFGCEKKKKKNVCGGGNENYGKSRLNCMSCYNIEFLYTFYQVYFLFIFTFGGFPGWKCVFKKKEEKLSKAWFI